MAASTYLFLRCVVMETRRESMLFSYESCLGGNLQGLRTLTSSGLRCSLRISLNRICFRGIKQHTGKPCRRRLEIHQWVCGLTSVTWIQHLPCPHPHPIWLLIPARIDFSHGTLQKASNWVVIVLSWDTSLVCHKYLWTMQKNDWMMNGPCEWKRPLRIAKLAFWP